MTDNDNPNKLGEFISYLHWEKGYDPIGASDIVRDAAQWFRVDSRVQDLTVEEAYQLFLESPVYKMYFPDGH